MIEERSAWEYRTEEGLNQWYGNVEIHDGRVLGQWFCLDAATGKLLWEREMSEPNSVSGVSKGIIVATTMESGGHWTSTSGIYGLSLETGETLWEAEALEPKSGFFARFFSNWG